MLRISVVDSRTECRLVLEGKLIAPWVAELRTAWEAVNQEIKGRARGSPVCETTEDKSDRGRTPDCEAP